MNYWRIWIQMCTDKNHRLKSHWQTPQQENQSPLFYVVADQRGCQSAATFCSRVLPCLHAKRTLRRPLVLRKDGGRARGREQSFEWQRVRCLGESQDLVVTSPEGARRAHAFQLHDGIKWGTLLQLRHSNGDRDRWVAAYKVRLDNMIYETKCKARVPFTHSGCRMQSAVKMHSERWSPLSTNYPKRGHRIGLTLQMFPSILNSKWGALSHRSTGTPALYKKI